MASDSIFFKILTVLFFVVFIVLYGGINYYIGNRIWNGTFRHMSFTNKKIYWSIYWLVVLSYIAAALLRNYPGKIVSALELIGSMWMGMLFYLFILFIFIDLVKFILKRLSTEGILNIFSNSRMQITLSVVTCLLIIGFLVSGMRAAAQSKVSTYNLNLKKALGSGRLKVVMISDVHIGSIIDGDRVQKLVVEINELKPDVVLMAGDIIDSSLEPFIRYNIKDILKNIKSTYGVFASMGNHEGFSEEVEKIVNEYEAAGLKVLRDEVVLVNNSFYIGGRIDVSMARAQKIDRKSVVAILEGIDSSKPIFIMDHQPVEFDKVKDAGVDLLVSGHTHRGQLAPANLITSRIFELDYGHLKKDSLNIIVSSGYGTWGPPMRVGSQSEIVEINISSDGS